MEWPIEKEFHTLGENQMASETLDWVGLRVFWYDHKPDPVPRFWKSGAGG